MTGAPASTSAPGAVALDGFPAVALSGIVKRFGSATALAGVDFDVRRGEIHGLLGENGAGKTTLMNILFGLMQPDAGTISFDGEPVSLRDPHDAVARGVGMVHQHFMLVPTLTVTENVLLGERGGAALTRRRISATERALRECSDRYGLGIDPSAPVWQLSVGEQQRAEILRALYRNAKVLVLDEPTATLTPVEAARMLPRLRAMAVEGSAVVLITHHLDEVITHTDRITILRAGSHVATLRPADTTTKELARLMVGREVSSFAVGAGVGTGAGAGVAAPSPTRRVVVALPGAGPTLDVSRLEADGATGERALHGVDLSVSGGEIVAIAGVEGNGQTELEEVLVGLRAATSGSVSLDGRAITGLPTAERLTAGMGVIPSDRYRRGLVRALSVADNLVLDRIGEAPYGSPLRISRRAVAANADEQVERFSIRVARAQQPVAMLSGGNAQRVVIARALSRRLRLLIAAQPSRGLDVGAIEFVWGELDAARAKGVAILLVSTDLDEVFALADRCVVMYGGRIVTSWSRSELDREQIGMAMGGALGSDVRDDRSRLPEDPS